MILTVEQMLRLAGIPQWFISGGKPVYPNQKCNRGANPCQYEDHECDICCLFRHCLSCSVDSCERFGFGITVGLKEFKYQLWEGERYDTLEALKPCLVRYI